MKNVKDLRNELIDVFAQVKSNKIEIKQAKAIVAVSNSILKSTQLELDHSKLIGSRKAIDFLKT